MLKYGCMGLSWWKKADIDMIESSWSTTSFSSSLGILSNGQSEMRENTGLRDRRGSEKGKV